MDYKLLQLTNSSVGSVSSGGFLPLGNVTGRVNCPYRLDGAISVATTGSNVVVIGASGHYKVNYNASLTIGTAGSITVGIVINGTTVYTASTMGAVGSNNISLDYEFKVKCDNIPTNIQLVLGGSDITAGVSNTIIEKVY